MAIQPLVTPEKGISRAAAIQPAVVYMLSPGKDFTVRA
jgi:hypothetical protein